jgi:SNF2 family DNA or RNA helicase
MTKAFAHQTQSIKHNASTPLVFDCSDPGTGKTFVRIMGFAKRRAGGSGAMLVLAPRSLLRSVWANDIRKFAPQLRVSVADASNRAAAFEADADVYVTNVDAVKWLAEQKPAFFKRFDELVIDESTAYKHHTSQRSKAASQVSRFFKHRCCLTGTPNSNSITDVWHQAYILDGGARLGNSFYRFRDSVCTPTQVGRNANALKWADKEGAEEAVFSLLSDIVIRHKFEDCVDIPPNHQYVVDYELTPKQMRSYIELETSQMLTLRGKAPAILAINAAAVATKLLQVASGAVYDGMGGYQVIDNARYEMVLDLVEQRKHSLVIFLWKHQRNALIAEAEKRGVSWAVLDGETSDRRRDEIVQGFQAGVYQVIFGHPKTVAHGYTLTKGTATIWASPTYDLEHFKQGSKRMHRIGQTQKTETIIIVAKGTIDEKAYELMEGKNARMTNLLDLFGTLNPVAAPAKKTKKVKEPA